MIIYTGCPGCGKALTLDLKHKEAYAPPEKQVTAAGAICESCRQQIYVDIFIKPQKKG